MYNNELKLFQRSKDVLWTDKHISNSMLDAHLDETFEGASRTIQKRTEIINWVKNNIKPRSKIIDLGCGPGLYAHELGKLGHNVLGIDFNKMSIDYAQENKSIKGVVEYRYCNYLQDSIEGKYNVAMMIYCDFGALIPDEQKLLLNRLDNILENDRIFIFDVFGKEEMKKQNEKRNWHISQGEDFWSKEPYFYMEEMKVFEKENTLGKRHYLVNQTRHEIKEYILWDQYYDEDSIKKLMLENGFETIKIKKALLKNENTLFVIAKKRKKTKNYD
jgi:SAM-dependent methyltransferase